MYAHCKNSPNFVFTYLSFHTTNVTLLTWIQFTLSCSYLPPLHHLTTMLSYASFFHDCIHLFLTLIVIFYIILTALDQHTMGFHPQVPYACNFCIHPYLYRLWSIVNPDPWPHHWPHSPLHWLSQSTIHNSLTPPTYTCEYISHYTTLHSTSNLTPQPYRDTPSRSFDWTLYHNIFILKLYLYFRANLLYHY